MILIKEVKKITKERLGYRCWYKDKSILIKPTKSKGITVGGIYTKVKAAYIATKSGIPTIIAKG